MIRINSLLIVALILTVSSAAGTELSRKTVQANHVAEFEFVTVLKRADPFNEVSLDVIFTEPGGRERRVPAYWAGDRVWKVRYASPLLGTHRFRSESSDARDTGLHRITGSAEVEPYKGDNPAYAHGPLRVAKGSRYFEHADGTPFLWLGDTWWMSLTKRLEFPSEFETLALDRKKKGFNVIQIIAGLYPDMPAFDERGANEAGFPWEKDYSRIRPEYFDKADERIQYLVEQGFTPCIVSTWGFHLPWLGLEKMQQHQRYVYARWGALPMVWCVAGELNLPFYTNPGFPHGAEKQVADWETVLKYCRSINSFDRLITAHPAGGVPISMRAKLKDPTPLDFDMLQTPHGQMDALPATVDTVRYSYNAKPSLPVVNAEPSYEMLLDKTPPEIARLMFWASWTNGVKGYTYGANGIWQLNRKGKPYGNSPWGGSYGKISWDEAMNLAGSAQVALGTKLLSEFAWEKFEPQPAWASLIPRSIRDVKIGDWIWFPEGDPAKDAPPEARFFRQTFELPSDAIVEGAWLRFAADDRATVWLNGEEIGTVSDWSALRELDAVAGKLKPGRNVLAVRVENVKSNVARNPAGLAGGMLIELKGGDRVAVSTATDWRVSKQSAAGWQKPEFDDKGWSAAKSAAGFGAAPWGQVGLAGDDAYIVPYAMGIPHAVRIVYVPQSRPILIKALEPGVLYAASTFDPTTGDRKSIGDATPDSAATWRCEPPARMAHDWVLILEAKK